VTVQTANSYLFLRAILKHAVLFEKRIDQNGWIEVESLTRKRVESLKRSQALPEHFYGCIQACSL
jgi:hypothetical protein